MLSLQKSTTFSFPPPSPPDFICWPWCHMIWDIPAVIWDQLSWLCSFPNPWALPIFWLVGWGAEKALTLCKCCSAVAKTSLYYYHHFSTNPKYSPIPAIMKKMNSTPGQNQHTTVEKRWPKSVECSANSTHAVSTEAGNLNFFYCHLGNQWVTSHWSAAIIQFSVSSAHWWRRGWTPLLLFL